MALFPHLRMRAALWLLLLCAASAVCAVQGDGGDAVAAFEDDEALEDDALSPQSDLRAVQEEEEADSEAEEAQEVSDEAPKSVAGYGLLDVLSPLFSKRSQENAHLLTENDEGDGHSRNSERSIVGGRGSSLQARWKKCR